MPIRPGPFVSGQIALALARVPGRMERDEDEAYRILDHIIASYKRGEFTDEEVVVRFGDPPQLRTLKSLPEDARGEIESLSRLIWRDAVMLSFGAAKRYVETSSLAGAPRLLVDWFTDDATLKSGHHRGRSDADRPIMAVLDAWMKANYQPGAKRTPTLEACRKATGATWREAAAAFKRLPDDVRLAPGQKRLPQRK